MVSHLALSMKGIEVPRGFMACHRCDNTFCINTDHLFVGTGKENMADASAKGRLANGKKEVCKYGHPLTAERVCRMCAQRRYLNWKERRRG